MKKTVVKKLIAAVLAVSTITASAALFTGCGKNEAPAVSGAQSSGAATESSQQATETSGPIDLKGFLSEIVDKKQYKIAVIPQLPKIDIEQLLFCCDISNRVVLHNIAPDRNSVSLLFIIAQSCFCVKYS